MALSTRLTSTPAVRTPRLPRPSLRVSFGLLSAMMLVLTVDATLNAHSFFDVRLARAIQALDIPFLADLFRPVDSLTAHDGAIIMWAAVMVGFLALRWWIPAMLLMTLPAGAIINELIGEFAGRTRPSADLLDRVIGHTDAPSFPSGHVMGAVMLYGFLFVVADKIQNRVLRATVRTLSLGIVLLIGPARIYYGAHWPTDVAGAYILGGMWVMGLAALYHRMEAAWGGLPLIKAGVVEHDESLPHAHALTSTVIFRGGEVAKVYAPGLLPRMLYWLSFQAEFPYIRNRHALRAAMYRRNLAAMLTAHWYGESRVAIARRIEPAGDGFALVSDFVNGTEPADKVRAKAFLTDLRNRFEEAGLPTWQIDPRQPRAVDNLLETADGTYMVVDLESGLASPLASVATWKRALRSGDVPLFDTVFYSHTRAYVAREEAAMRAQHGDAWTERLLQALDLAEDATTAWQRSEPRIWSKIVRIILAPLDMPRLTARAKASFEGSNEKARQWVGEAVTRWELEGRVTAKQATEMRVQMEQPEFQAMLPHLGAHLVISLALRFPFGSIARAAWTLGALGTATARLMLRKIDRKEWAQAWRLHSPLVTVIGAIPGFGTFAYMAAAPVRSNRLLLRATGDAMMYKLPWNLYTRTRLHRLIQPRTRFEVQQAQQVAYEAERQAERQVELPVATLPAIQPSAYPLPIAFAARTDSAVARTVVLPSAGGRMRDSTAAAPERR